MCLSWSITSETAAHDNSPRYGCPYLERGLRRFRVDRGLALSQRDWQQQRAASHRLAIASINKNLFVAMQNLRTERGMVQI